MLRAPVIAPHDELQTLPEAARVLGVSPPTLRLWAYQQRLPARRIGRMTYFRRADVEAYRAERDKSGGK